MSRQSLAAACVVELVAVGDDADLAAGLDRVGLLDAGEAAGQGLQLFEPPDVLLQRLAAGAGAAGADGVGGGDQDGVGGVDPDVVVVAERGVDDLLALAVALASARRRSSGWPPSISWSAALPMSCSRPQRRPRAPSRPISSAIRPVR